MGALRKQMDGDLVVRGMSVRTRESYLGAVAGLAKHYGRSPDTISEQEVQDYRRARARMRPFLLSAIRLFTIRPGVNFFGISLG